MKMDVLNEAKTVFDIEIDALAKVRDSIDERFIEIFNKIVSCKGKVVFLAIGKPGHIGKKLAASFSSLGTPSFSLNAAEAQHGDLGMIDKNDVVVAISYSGESDEVIRLIPNIKQIGCTLIGISGNASSTLIKNCDISYVFPEFEEACALRLAPTSSTTATLVLGDALAVAASKYYGFQKENFGFLHPAGALGKKLILKVKDIMFTDDDVASLELDSTLRNAIFEMTKKRQNVAVIVSDNLLKGFISDGDIRRALEKHDSISGLLVREIMTENPISIEEDKLAVEAMKIMNDKKITAMPVLDKKGELKGIISLQEISKKGIVL